MTKLDEELEKILRREFCQVCKHRYKLCEAKYVLGGKVCPLDRIITRIKTLPKKVAKEGVHYKVMNIGEFDDEGNLIKKYSKPKEVIITDSEVIKEILKNIDEKFK